MLVLAEAGVACFAQFADLCTAFWVYGDWWRWYAIRSVDSEEGAVEGVEDGEFVI